MPNKKRKHVWVWTVMQTEISLPSFSPSHFLAKKGVSTFTLGGGQWVQTVNVEGDGRMGVLPVFKTRTAARKAGAKDKELNKVALHDNASPQAMKETTT